MDDELRKLEKAAIRAREEFEAAQANLNQALEALSHAKDRAFGYQITDRKPGRRKAGKKKAGYR